MRDRRRILDSLEATYREAFAAAKERKDVEAMARLDLDFQRDQLQLEVLLDIRDVLAPAEEEPPKERSLLEEGSALIEKAGALRRIVRLR
jgi:hypothetical protein